MQLNLESAHSLLRHMDAEEIQDMRLKVALEKAVQALQVQGPDGRVTLPPDLEGAVRTIVEARADMQSPKSAEMNISGARTLFADMEKLIALFAQMSRENRELNREATYESLLTRVSQLNQAASTRQEGAQQLRSSAAGALAMNIIGGGLSIAAGGFGARLSFKGDVGSSMVQHIQTGSQGTNQLFSGAANLAGSEGAANNQMQQAGADKMQAEAEESNAEFQRAQAYENEFRDMASKMNEVLRSMLEAKNKATEAAARA